MMIRISEFGGVMSMDRVMADTMPKPDIDELIFGNAGMVPSER